ncbi:MAG: LacI family DNA-binding transcriptional regulator, partial [Lentisphaeria bacterium]|nr:LacI family DNA-binding transcriptional regulator [Lentisphaeria bacterium]
ACRLLTGMGHRRVVFISSREMRHPEPSRHIEALAGELDACGTAAGPYNTPEWDETPAGLMALLENMFRLTPPTAILVEDANWLAGVLSFLARHGLRVPRDVSLVCLSHDPTFPWLRPEMAHLRVDNMEMVKRVVRWAEEIARGREDRTCVPCHAEFVPGASTGPVAG